VAAHGQNHTRTHLTTTWFDPPPPPPPHHHHHHHHTHKGKLYSLLCLVLLLLYLPFSLLACMLRMHTCHNRHLPVRPPPVPPPPQGNDDAFSFLECVLDQVISQFPCSYIHIGGDEVPKVSGRGREREEGRGESHE